jgi:hypothetical protein
MEQGKHRFLEVEQIDVDVPERSPKWQGDWSFNTNERYVEGAYRRMLKDGAIAVCGYGPKTKEILNRPRAGDRIFAYLNGRGVIAFGRIGGELAYPSGTIFRQSRNDEHHRTVLWEAVVNEDTAITPAEVSRWGYNYPCRPTLCVINNGKVAERIAKELQRRAQSGCVVPTDVS